MLATTTQSSDVVLVVAVFLASAVEMVEALTIVLAVGLTRGWRSAMAGVAVAVLTLGLIVVTVGPAIVRYVPLSVLRLVVGGVLLVFGLQWLRKAILRAGGVKAKHDEDRIFAEQVHRLQPADGGSRQGLDHVAFTVAFKGVFLEGLEVVIVVITLGATSHRLGLAAAAAGAAVLVVGVAGLVVARQLSGVPENAMKFGVGLMLVSFGTFWCGEGVHVRWPGSDLAIPVLVAGYGAVAWALVALLHRRTRSPVAAGDPVGHG